MSEEILSFEEAIEKYDPVLGFEVHVELNTKTKMFDAAPNEFGDEPNTNISPVSLGLPGVLPVVNKAAVESGIKLGLALGCDIAPLSYFARKNYFYPDTPKNFQTSQHRDPIAENGKLDVELEDGTVFTVEIERAHMEEDAGKLTHVCRRAYPGCGVLAGGLQPCRCAADRDCDPPDCGRGRARPRAGTRLCCGDP